MGYQESTPVLVQHGRVLSHRGISWERFCERVNEGRRLPKPDAPVGQKITNHENN
jgi:hypothetical protein